jgi:hypothetical protein
MKMIGIISVVLFLFSTNLIAQGGINTLYFDGTDDYVNCGMDTSLDITNSITIEAWVKVDNTLPGGVYHRIVDKYLYTAQQGYNLMIERNTKVAMFEFWATDGSKNYILSNEPLNDELWHHVAVTYDGNILCMYVDGFFVGQDTIGVKTIRICPKALIIGDGHDGNVWHPFKGKIEEVCLWKTALDSATVRDWAHKKITSNHPARSNLVGYWKFNEGSGSFTADSSGIGNHGTLTNMDTTSAWNTSDVPMATSITQSSTNVSAIWTSVDSNASSILSLVDTTLTDEDCIIFGHNNDGVSWTNNNVPTNLGVLNRLNRVWRCEVYGSLSGAIIFDLTDLNFTNGNALKLLVDADGVFSDADTVHGIYDNINSCFRVNNYTFQHGYYYTLGSQENIVSNKSGNTEVNPHVFQLYPNYPNPFNPVTHICFDLPRSEDVQLLVYDVLGRQVSTLVNEKMTAGSHEILWDAQDAPSGIYIYQIKTGKFVETKKMILLK